MKKIDFRKDVAPHLLAVVVFLVVTILFFNPIFFDNKTLDQHDIQQRRQCRVDVADKSGIKLLPTQGAPDHSERKADQPPANNPDGDRTQKFQTDDRQYRGYGLHHGAWIDVHKLLLRGRFLVQLIGLGKKIRGAPRQSCKWPLVTLTPA